MNKFLVLLWLHAQLFFYLVKCLNLSPWVLALWPSQFPPLSHLGRMSGYMVFRCLPGLKHKREVWVFVCLFVSPAIYIFKIFLENANKIFRRLTASGKSGITLFYDSLPVILDFMLSFLDVITCFDHNNVWIIVTDFFLPIDF